MKQIRFALILFNSLLLSLTLIGLILPSGCSKEAITNFVTEEETEDYSDMVAYFSGFESILYLLPEYQEAVLASLEADLAGEQEGVALMQCYDGEQRLFSFKIVSESSQSALATKANNARKKAEEELKKWADDLLERPLDKQSYHGRDCLPVPEQYGTCHVIGSNSSQTYKYPRKKCKPVTGSTNICTETNTPGMSETRTYKNRNCNGSYTAKETFEWVCR